MKNLWRSIFVAFLVLMSGCIGVTSEEASDVVQIYFVNVGQGDAILIDRGTFEIMIDGGRYAGSLDWNMLSAHIDGPLEYLIATHPDADHIGGLDAVLAEFEVLEIWHNGASKDTAVYQDFIAAAMTEGATIRTPRRGNLFAIAGMVLRILNPIASDPGNSGSIVIELSYGNTVVLLTGDIEEETENELATLGLLSDVDILKVSHHGSASSSSAAFLDIVKPELAFISASVSNSFGHPSPEAIQRLYCEANAEIYCTSVHGLASVDIYLDRYVYSVKNGDVPPLIGASCIDPIPAGPVAIDHIFYDGLVPTSEADEYVQITNHGAESVDISGWELKDISDNGPTFAFLSEVLEPGETIRVYTNQIHAEWGGYSFGYGRAVWCNKEGSSCGDADVAVLFNQYGEEVCRKSY